MTYGTQTLPRPLSPALKRPAGLSRRQHASETLHHSRANPLNMFDAPSVSITAAHGCMLPSRHRHATVQSAWTWDPGQRRASHQVVSVSFTPAIPRFSRSSCYSYSLSPLLLCFSLSNFAILYKPSNDCTVGSATYPYCHVP